MCCAVITIKTPKLIPNGADKIRVATAVEIDGEEHELWFEVANKYATFLLVERADAVLVGLLHYALRHGHDIVCEPPVTEELHYKITTFLIPSLCRNSGKFKFHPAKITAPLAGEPLTGAGAIGTGCSLGVDSFHAIVNQRNSPYKTLNITHLVHNNVGSHGFSGSEKANILARGRRELVHRFASENGFELIETDSNFSSEFPMNHYLTHTYSSAYAIHSLVNIGSTWRSRKICWRLQS